MVVFYPWFGWAQGCCAPGGGTILVVAQSCVERAPQSVASQPETCTQLLLLTAPLAHSTPHPPTHPTHTAARMYQAIPPHV